MKPMSFSETIFLFFLALIIFGPKKLPEIARQAGKLLNEFRRASNEFKAQIEQEIAHLEVESKQPVFSPSPTPEGTASRTLNAAPAEASPVEAAAAPSASEDEPLFAAAAESTVAPSTQKSDSHDQVPSTTQESHV